MPLLKGNLHTHTTLSDGALTPTEILDRYRDRGYDFLAFTDHRCMIGRGDEQLYWSRLPTAKGMLILYGVEEEPPEIAGRHLGVISGIHEQLRILNHPNEYAMSVEEVVRSVALVAADAVEVTHHGRYLEEYDVDIIPVPKIATDDAHYEHEIGVSWIEVEAARDVDSVLRAIKAGDFLRFINGDRR